MSARNSLKAKRQRRRVREIRHVGGCSICGDQNVVWCSEHDAADPSYRGICRVHLCYAVSTLLVGENAGPQGDDLPESWSQRSVARRVTRHQKTESNNDPLPQWYQGKRIPTAPVTVPTKAQVGQALRSLFGQDENQQTVQPQRYRFQAPRVIPVRRVARV